MPPAGRARLFPAAAQRGDAGAEAQRAPAGGLGRGLVGVGHAVGDLAVGAVVAEFVSGTGQTQGLAWRLLEAGNRLRTADLLATLVCLAVMGVALNAAIAWLERRAAR